MLRRRLLACSGAFALTTVGLLQHVHAATAWLPSSNATPIEQRVAVAVSQTRTTIWTSLRVDAVGAPVGLLIPVPAGAALDHSSDAWLEALDAATAPRVFPPGGASIVCPGQSPNPDSDPFHVTSDLGKTSSAEPIESAIVADVPAVVAWASTHGFSISSDVASALENMPGMRFFVERFVAQPAPFVTSTLRVVLPGKTPVLPLALTRAGASDLRVTAWFVGAGRASLTGTSPVKLHLENLHWNANSQDSNYVDLRASEILEAGPAALVTEASSHDALLKNVAIANGKGAITGVVTSYFQRAASYLDGNENATACITSAAVLLESTLDVAESCPRADLGVVDGVPSCVEAPNASQIDPAKLRCGGRADDLSIALSGLEPATTWLTRVTMILPKNTIGQTWPIAFTPVAPEVEPILTATSIDFSGCGASGSSSSSSSGASGGSSSGSPWPWPGSSSSSSGSGSSTSGTYYEPSYDPDMACGCAGAADPVILDDVGAAGSGGDGGSGGDAYYDDDSSSDDCSGDTTDTDYDDDSSSDDCSGDTTDTDYDDGSSADDCDGDTTDTDYGDDSSSDDCAGDTTDDSYDDDSSSSSEGIDCSGDTSDDSDSSDSSECTVARKPHVKPHKRGPKASVITLGLLAIIAPLRRFSRPRRTARDRKDKQPSSSAR